MAQLRPERSHGEGGVGGAACPEQDLRLLQPGLASHLLGHRQANKVGAVAAAQEAQHKLF